MTARLSTIRGAALALLAGAAPAAAQPSFRYDAVSVSARRYVFGSVVERQDDVAPAGSPALASVLEQFATRYPISQSALPGGFVSSLMTGTGFGGVGLSFWSPHTPDRAAVALWTQEITNVGDAVGALEATFDIPIMHASILAGPSYGPFPVFAKPGVFAGARLRAARFAEDGTELGTTNVFDYHLGLERRFQGSPGAYCLDLHEVTVSDDLRARRPTEWRVIQERDVCGVEYLPFSGTVSLPTLAARERLVVTYELWAENLAWRSQTPELGYQAMVGDPFTVSGAGGIVVRPSAVPEPGTALLLGTGLAGAALARRRQRRGSSVHTAMTPQPERMPASEAGSDAPLA